MWQMPGNAAHKREDRKTAYIQALAVASVIGPPRQLPRASSSLLGVPLWDDQSLMTKW